MQLKKKTKRCTLPENQKLYEQQKYTCSKDDQMNLRPKTSEAEENRQSDG